MTRPSTVRVVAVEMADGSDPYSPENRARIARALLSLPKPKAKPSNTPAKKAG